MRGRDTLSRDPPLVSSAVYEQHLLSLALSICDILLPYGHRVQGIDARDVSPGTEHFETVPWREIVGIYGRRVGHYRVLIRRECRRKRKENTKKR
jgi:hypothetical protein